MKVVNDASPHSEQAANEPFFSLTFLPKSERKRPQGPKNPAANTEQKVFRADKCRRRK